MEKSEGPVFHYKGIDVPIPPRTDRKPVEYFERDYLALVQRDWLRFCRSGIDQLGTYPSTEINLKMFLPETLNPMT